MADVTIQEAVLFEFACVGENVSCVASLVDFAQFDFHLYLGINTYLRSSCI